MSLTLKTLKKADQLLEDDRIQKIESNVYLVYGSKDDVYQVEFSIDPDTSKIITKCQCKGFKIHGDCYHSEAIRRKEEIKK